MANLRDIILRRSPEPWRDGDNIPWHEPGFSRRMLREHLSQRHDMASRRDETIHAHVAWIASLVQPPARVLDLACGPGFYCERLARMGYACTGIDYSPASIEHAQQVAARDALACAYTCEDLRAASYGRGHSLALLLSGELNCFKRDDAKAIVAKCWAALAEGGVFVLEAHTPEAVQAIARSGTSWYASESGLFSETPHLCLREAAWDERSRTATERYWITDEASGEVSVYATTKQSYTEEEYRALLEDAGFTSATFHPSLRGQPDPEQPSFMVVVATKPT